MPSLTLICPTKNRTRHVRRRIPIWCRSGIDEVLIVDATSDPIQAAEIEESCRQNDAQYLRIAPSFRDTRSRDRNLGAQYAKTEWILFQDDDEDIIAEFDHEGFDRAADGTDFIWNGRGNSIIYHRRANFLRLRGYPEDMVSSEDVVFSWLVHATSVGRLEGDLYQRVEPAHELWEQRQSVFRRMSNLFWYPFTFLRYLERAPPDQRENVILGLFMLAARSARVRSNPVTVGLVLAVYGYGLVTGFAWHYIRKAFDSRFRQSIRSYQEALFLART